MDNRTFISRLSRKTEGDAKETQRLASSLGNLIAECIAEGNDVAIPGFGSFNSVKTLEHVEINPSTGKKTLVPPSVNVEFRMGSHLKKSIIGHE